MTFINTRIGDAREDAFAACEKALAAACRYEERGSKLAMHYLGIAIKMEEKALSMSYDSEYWYY